MEAISQDNILSKWRVEYKALVMEETPAWLEEEQQSQAQGVGQEQQEWGAKKDIDILEGDVVALTPPST